MSGGPSAATKARQRALNGNATKSGSSGMSTLLLDMERKTWEEIEPVADHIADIGGLMYGGQLTAAGTLTIQIGAPMEYAHDMTDIAIAGKQGALFIRVYAVTPESMTRDQGQERDSGDSDGDGFDGGQFLIGGDFNGGD